MRNWDSFDWVGILLASMFPLVIIFGGITAIVAEINKVC